ncbi:MAG: DUF3392 domain-containing protein [Reinekea sp.]|jgi:cation transport ATPase
MIIELLADFSGWFRPHLTFIASALIATILVIYGERINKAVWALVKGAHFIIRTLVFVILCAFGYGAIAVFLVPWVKKVLLLPGSLWLGPVVVVAFFLVGWLAEKRSRRG